MHFVLRGDVPHKLKEYHGRYTKDWEEYHSQEGKAKKRKAPPSRWTHLKIRIPLFQDFWDNCGYCGRSPGGTVPSNKNQEELPIGIVDHYRPKSQFPNLVYEWSNLVWCCEGCNKRKSSFYHPDFLIFDPCNTEDVQYLELSMDGSYQLNYLFQGNKTVEERCESTKKYTLINSSGNINDRRLKKESLEGILNALLKYSKEGVFFKKSLLRNSNNENLKKFENIYNKKISKYFLKYLEDLIRHFQETSYKRMTQYLVEKFLELHPSFKEPLDQLLQQHHKTRYDDLQKDFFEVSYENTGKSNYKRS